jgi:hypothetical protein
MESNLRGRLRNTPLPLGHGLLPLFEAVVNAIHSVDERDPRGRVGRIDIDVLRSLQTSLEIDSGRSTRGSPPLESITGFRVTDNGVGFNEANMTSFRTLDTDHKANLGCRGVGRLLWLKAFDRVKVTSCFRDRDNVAKRRIFKFDADHGVNGENLSETAETSPSTSVELEGFHQAYRDRTPKTGRTIAQSLLEHCLWYFVRRVEHHESVSRMSRTKSTSMSCTSNTCFLPRRHSLS